MQKSNASQPNVDDISNDNYVISINQIQTDLKDAWLFFGEDDDFINAE